MPCKRKKAKFNSTLQNDKVSTSRECDYQSLRQTKLTTSIGEPKILKGLVLKNHHE